MQVKNGDVVTFMASGKATFKRAGHKAEKIDVGEGELVSFDADGELTGVDALVYRAHEKRTDAKRRARPQAVRLCGESLSVLEVPDKVDTEAERLEKILADRTQAMRHRLAMEAQKLLQK